MGQEIRGFDPVSVRLAVSPVGEAGQFATVFPASVSVTVNMVGVPNTVRV